MFFKFVIGLFAIVYKLFGLHNGAHNTRLYVATALILILAIFIYKNC